MDKESVMPVPQLDYEEQIFGSPGGKIISEVELVEILKYLRPKKSEKILDVGTCTGRVARKLVSIFDIDVIGIDVNKQDVRRANLKRKTLGDHGNKYELLVADGQFLPFKDSCFDSIVCIRTIKYFSNYQKGIREMSRVLKNQGKLILTLSNVFSIDFFLLRFRVLAYKTLFNLRKVAQYFKENNLVIIDYVGLHKIHPKIWMMFNNGHFLNFLKVAERVMQKITPKELFSREILVKLIRKP